MNADLVSILIPCYNGAPYLAGTLDSALGQTYSPTEIIVVDDGSTDNSVQIARGYGSRVRLIEGPQQGASHARNLATEAAQGSWLQYLDADDLLLPTAIADRVAAATEADVVCSDWRRIVRAKEGGWDDGALESGAFARYAGDPDLAVMKGFWCPPAAILYRRALVSKIGGWHAGLPVIQDARFLFDAAFNGGRFVHLASEGAKYRQHSEGSLSSRSKERFWSDVLKNNKEIERQLSDSGRLDDARRQALAASYGLGVRVSLGIGKELFRGFLSELSRFPDHRPSPYLRWAIRLEAMFGYSASRFLLGILRPNSHP